MTVQLKLAGSFMVLTSLLVGVGCATAPPLANPVEDSSKLEAPVATNDFSNIKILGESLDHSEEVFYEGDEALLPSVIENIKTKGKDLYLLHREAMNSQHRLRLMKLFIKVADPSMMPAFRLCLKEARADELQKNPVDLVKLLKSYQEGQLPLLSEDVFEAFRALRAHSGSGRHLVPAFFEAVTLNPNSNWAPRLIEMIEQPVVHPRSLASKQEQEAAVDLYRDQIFWQIAAIEALGALKETKAVPALFQVILEGKKGDFVATARLALIRIGQPSSAYGLGLLDGDHSEPGATLETLRILAAIRIYGGASQAIETLKLELSDEQRFQVASLLPNFGATPDVQAAFQAAFQVLDCQAMVEGISFCERLAPFAVYFFDAAMVPWLLDQAKAKKNDNRLSEANRASLAQALTLAALRLGTAKDRGRLLQGAKPNDFLEQTEDILALIQACGDEPSCYLSTVTQLKEKREASQLLGQRSLVALVALGGSTERDALIALLPDLDDHATLILALRAIDRLTPHHDERVVSGLSQYVAQMDSEKSPGEIRGWTRELLNSIETRPKAAKQKDDGGVVAPGADQAAPENATP